MQREGFGRLERVAALIRSEGFSRFAGMKASPGIAFAIASSSCRAYGFDR